MTHPARLQDPRRIDPVLRERYDVRGPRYTSYPAAPHFHPVDTEALFARWRERNGLAVDPGLSLYVHVPFCKVRCLFCGCHTLGRRDESTVARYLDALVAEMDLAAEVVEPSRPVRQLALGGGTPNYLSAAQLDRLLTAVETRWTLTGDAERSVELDPRVASPDQLDVFIAHGFNRFSLGIQDFSEPVLRGVGRAPVRDKVEAVLAHLRAHGRGAINFDLIYGLPGQTLATTADTAAQVIAHRPTRIALYSYAHVPWLRPSQEVLERRGLPSPDDKANLFLAMGDLFQEAGYQQVGMDHFALPEDELVSALRTRRLRRTFMGYTTGRGLDTLGFGVSAISWVGTTYSQDAKELEAYLDGIEAGRLPVVRGHLLSRDDLVRRALLLELFCTFEVDLDALSAEFDVDAAEYFTADLERLSPFADDGLLTWDRHRITLSETGRFFVRTVCMVFDAYLERDEGARRYSRTV